MENNSDHLAFHFAEPESSASVIYIHAEKRLAVALGKASAEELICVGCALAFHDKQFGTVFMPQWCRDSKVAFELMVEHDIDIDWAVDVSAVRAYVNTNEMYLCREVAIADHFDKTAAVRFAIVQVVIAKLESGINPDSPQAK